VQKLEAQVAQQQKVCQSKLAEQQKQIIALESQCRRTKGALIDANRRVREFYR
jgi:hypothetical protein